MIQIIDADPSHVDTIVLYNQKMAYETESLELDGDVLKKGVRAMFDDSSHGRYLVALVDGEVAGQAMVTYEWSDWRNGKWWWIQSVYVVPEHRRKGIFRAIYERLKNEAKEENAVGLRLYVERENKKAQATYTAMGMDGEHYRMFEEKFSQRD